MAAVTAPGYTYPPPDAPRPAKRRWWLIGLITVWILVLAATAFWSVGNEPATVPEQRDIGQAVPELQRAAGAVFAAAGGPGRAVVLGELEITRDCRVTPVRDGLVAAREVTVYVRAGEARAALEAIAAGLPERYRADVAVGRGGTRFSLHADAGNFIGIDSDSEAGAPAATVRLSTGCRPPGSGEPDRSDPPAGPAPAALGTVLTALGASPGGSGAGPAAVRAVACPAAGVAGTYVVDGVAAPADLAGSLRRVGDVVRADPEVRAYRTGADSVVVVPDGARLRVSVSTAC
jgi:hypothetical protein